MAAIADIIQQVTDVTSAWQAEKQGFTDTIATQKATIVDLQAQIAAAGTPAQLQTVSDGLTSLQTDISSTPTT